MKKVLYFTDMPSPYKVKFLNLLSKTCELLVYFERELHSNRSTDWIKDNRIQFRYRNIFSVISCFYKIPMEIIKEKPNVVFNCYYSSIRGILVAISCFLLNKKMVIIADGGIPIKRVKIVEWGISKLMGLAFSCFSSGDETDKYFEYYQVSSNKVYSYHFSSLTKCEINNHLIMVDKYQKQSIFSLLYVGQIIERKGLDIVLKAMSGIDNIKLNIVGGECTEDLKELIQELNIKNIQFHGFMTGKKLEEMYANCDAFVLPSRYEIWGLVVNEAISYNKPVITSNRVNAGLDLCVKYQCGLVFESEDVNDLRNKILDISSDFNLYKELSFNCKRVNKEFTIDQMEQDFTSFLDRV